MFGLISAMVTLLLFSSTLPNGIRLAELPAEGDTVEIVAGYTTGGLTGLSSSDATRNLLLAVYASGGKLDSFAEAGRTGIRVTAPRWALPMLIEHLPGLFREIPKGDKGPDPLVPDFRAKVEEEIRSALLGAREEAAEYSTDSAFLLISAPIPDTLRNELSLIPRRGSKQQPEAALDRLPAERTLRFKADLPTGAVVFASPLPGVYYRQWYSLLLLDRVIRRNVPLSLTTTLPLTLRPYYYRLELAVPSGQFPEPAEESLLQELQRLQFTPVNAQSLAAARQDALIYLESSDVREWFVSHDIPERREEGIQWIQSMTPDDMRVAARDLLIMNRVIATWAPKPKQTAVQVESLGEVKAATNSSESTDLSPVNPSISRLSFPAHSHPAFSIAVPERLSSGVSLAASNIRAMFVSGASFIPEADAAKYRADRLLVLTPSIDSARQMWNGFKGSNSTEIGVPRGPVSSGDLVALFVLKTLLDLKLIQAGWWNDAELRISASEGSILQIRADPARRAQILSWIKQAASEKPPDSDFNWVREVAMHRFDSVRADLQALTWERDPQGIVQDPETVSAAHVQDVARIYF